MIDATTIWAITTLLGAGMVCLTALKMWRGWLDLRRLQIAPTRDLDRAAEMSPSVRIEMANLKERLRKLEAIATGIDI